MRFRKSSIRDLRANEGLSLRDFAKRLGTSPVTVNNWELGIAKPGMSYLERICQEFDVHPGFFFDEN